MLSHYQVGAAVRVAMEIALGLAVLFFAWLVALFEGGQLAVAITPLSTLFFLIAGVFLVGPMATRRAWDLLRATAGTLIVVVPLVQTAFQGYLLFDVGVVGRAFGLPSAY